ncbi:hypothetical protein [Nitrosovibrio sp. Nv6]|uniref:hypothetical protein n=1 Tax=Nitrosovibrio sp. Nv6 TaxID=1855340 RepID=UPI0008D2D657|nr:hypothetical protein [Nitrosovibrio sp. Nv6]SEP02616.1 hypothetical protein SAMN05216316_1502 [Nitrosovibrio sp. Nv6]
MRRIGVTLMISLVYISDAAASDGCFPTCEKAIWAVDPAKPGPMLPPAGRSLFDFIAADGIPFPFEALVRKVEAHIGCTDGGCTTPVLIPLGRSLQRTAAAPDFFEYPRAVVAVTGEGAGPMVARDRLYLAYQEKMNLIEVISYNETAARFEFQLVRNYREDSAPRLVYANRNICISCHQNHSPIFSRQVWDETNANPKIAEELSQVRELFYGIPVHRGIDLPDIIDKATDRANLISVTQRIWREACDMACRVLAITAAVQYRLSGGRIFDVSALAQTLSPGFAARWPAGLAIPNPDIPNRDPLAFPPGTQGVAQSHVLAVFDPLAPRTPLETWIASDPLLLARRFVVGLADLIAERDIHDLDALLARHATQAARRIHIAPCTLSGERYDCAGEFTLRGGTNFIDALAIGDEPSLHFSLKNGIATSHGLRARTTDGNLIERITVTHERDKAEATVAVVEDFAHVRAIIAKFNWSDAPINRMRLRLALGLDTQDICCQTAVLLEPAQADLEMTGPVPEPGAAFKKACGACHLTAERFPPNFLAGDERRVSASLAQCAPRIFVRLSMWHAPPASRDKVPMPPPLASRKGSPWVQAAPHPSIAVLRNTVAEWLRAETGRVPDARAMVAHGYENLRRCLPPADATAHRE